MKRILSFILTFILLFSLVSCSSVELEQTEEEKQTSSEKTQEAEQKTHDIMGSFAVGYAKGEISPMRLAVPLAGYGNTSFRNSRSIKDKIYFTIVAVTDAEGETALVCTVDLVSFRTDEFAGQCRKILSEATGVSQDNIIMSCTHTHSAPDASADGSDLSTWKRLVYSAVREAGKAAMDNRDKSEMYIGSTNVQGLNFVRRYVLADGTYLGDNSGNTSTAPIVGHETDADTQLQILKFDRENEKDIILANFQAHPTMTGGSTKYEVSADYPGAFRKAVEKDLDVEFAFFQGAAGNLNPNSRIEEEKHDKDYVAYGRTLADALIAKLPELEKVEMGEVRTMTKSVDCTINHSTDSKVEAARIVSAAFSTNDSQKTASLCAQYGFSSGFAANAVINRSTMPETVPVEIYAVSIGDVAFVGSPYEMFDTSGMEIKAASPYKMTFVCEQTNSTNGYMPSALAFEHAGYEVDICKFVSGTAENLVQEYLNMLNTMHAE